MNRRDFNLALLGTIGSLSLNPFIRFQSQLRVNGPRIVEHLTRLAEFGKTYVAPALKTVIETLVKAALGVK